jgi:glyoxylase-like metal-dependent hydrolase (beta-lactamase superfamily II)
MSYAKGLHELGVGCHAWLQPDGGWGWSNSGLIVGAGASLLVDTLIDLVTTGEMLDGIRPLTDTAPVAIVVNTHSDCDHFFGNELVAGPGVEIIASESAAASMTQHAVDEMLALSRAGGRTGRFAETILKPFRLDDITVEPPTSTFRDRLSVDVGGREVELIEVGPAHTDGDVLVHVPDARTLYAGDILFIGGTPIVWAGPPRRWVDACELLLDMPLTTIVPGHGPVTDKNGVRQVRDYLEFVITEATKRYEDGLDLDAAITSIDLGRYAGLSESGRLAQNVAAVYQALDPALERRSRLDIFGKIADLEGFTDPAPAGAR